MGRQAQTHDATDAEKAAEMFEKSDLDPEAVLGERTYDGLYSVGAAEENIPVDVRTGEQTQAVPSVGEARAFASKAGSHSPTPYVAAAASTATMIETQSAPYTGCAFCNRKITGSMDYHYVYLGVFYSPDYEVRLSPDYQAGELTIEVEKAE